jgi:hypothetical protein
MAEEEPAEFKNVAASYRSTITAFLSHRKNIEGKVWIDSCFLQSSSLESVLNAVVEVRDKLLSNSRPVFSRASLLLDSFRNEQGDFSLGAARLQGKVSKLKACAVEIEDSIIRDHASEKIKFFANYYWSSAAKLGLIRFWDIAFSSESCVQKELNILKLFEQIEHAISRSDKSPRFFTPLLVNLARHLEGTKLVDFVRFIDKNDEVYNLLKRELPEGEFVFFTLIDRYFEDENSDFGKDVSKVIQHWAGFNRGWLLDRLNKENKHGPVPDVIIRPENRGKWRALARR